MKFSSECLYGKNRGMRLNLFHERSTREVYYCVVGHSARVQSALQIYISRTSSVLFLQSNIPSLACFSHCFLSCIVGIQLKQSLIQCWISNPLPTYSLAAHKSPLSELHKAQRMRIKDKLCLLPLQPKQK